MARYAFLMRFYNFLLTFIEGCPLPESWKSYFWEKVMFSKIQTEIEKLSEEMRELRKENRELREELRTTKNLLDRYVTRYGQLSPAREEEEVDVGSNQQHPTLFQTALQSLEAPVVW